MANAPAGSPFAPSLPASGDAGGAIALLDRLVEAVEGGDAAMSHKSGQGSAAVPASRDLGRIDEKAKALVADGRQAVMHGFELAASAEELASASGDVTRAMDDAGRRVRDALAGVRGASGMILDLAKAAEAMTGVVDAIVSVARQANLLALHATIEAARAGEAGRDFSSVAGDVKSLSEKTGHAARDMRERIARLHDTTTASVRAVERIMVAVQGAQPALAAAAVAVEDHKTSLRQVAQQATDLSITVGGISEQAAVVAALTDAARAAAEEASASSDDLAGLLRERFDTRHR